MELKKRFLLLCLLFVSFYFVTAQKRTTGNTVPPHLKINNGITRLMVHNEPFTMLCGEVNNSASSNLPYMQAIWPRLKALHLNTVIVTVSWELLEPAEGQFDFTLVDGLIKEARARQLKLVLLWFGTWKNTWSTYVPVWVKKDTTRFPRMYTAPGNYSGALTAFGKESVKADARAFAALMRHIREVDEKENTVIMMQVENETGLLGTARDYSPLATLAFEQQVPQALLSHLQQQGKNQKLKQIMTLAGNRSSGTWREVFGYAAAEVFMAWHIASYVEQVTWAGKKEYNIPMYTNAWLDPDFENSLVPDYPSGGPVSKVMDVWKAAAPSIDLLAPDIYIDDFKRVCDMYARSDNPLFIPEAAKDLRSAANVYYALGQHHALGFSPFKIEQVAEDHPLAASYASLTGFLPFLAKNQKPGNSIGLLYTGKDTASYQLGGYRIFVEYTMKRDPDKKQPEAAAIVLNTAPNEFYITGYGVIVHFWPLPGDTAKQVEFLENEEGVFSNGQWIPGRWMNGDEMIVQLKKKPEYRRILLHKF